MGLIIDVLILKYVQLKKSIYTLYTNYLNNQQQKKSIFFYKKSSEPRHCGGQLLYN